MTVQNANSGRGARLRWAILSPVLLALAAFTYVGVPFLPGMCIYLDGRSRTYTAAVSLVVLAALSGYAFGPMAAAVAAFVVLTTAVAYLVYRLRMPFSAGLVASGVGGIAGMLVWLVLYNALAGWPLNEVAASGACKLFAGVAMPGVIGPLDFFTALSKSAAQAQPTDPTQLLLGLYSAPPQWVTGLSTAEKVTLAKPYLSALMSSVIPAFSIAFGTLAGGLSYFLPAAALSRRRAKLAEGGEVLPQAPAFAAFKIPVYAIVSLWLLQILSSMGTAGGWGNFEIVYYSVSWLLDVLMVTQALALLSFLMNRKRIGSALQVVILVPVTVLFSWLLIWVGIFDALFNIRTVISRVDVLKSKGKQVFTQDGLEELRRMDDELKKKSKKNNDDDWKDGDE